MSRQKLPDEDKRKEFSITMNEKLNTILEKYMTEKGIDNKSKYIERLVEEDMKNKNGSEPSSKNI
jgi:metal-responsive CopG/Arc/MetJ family transcriptional regulator